MKTLPPTAPCQQSEELCSAIRDLTGEETACQPATLLGPGVVYLLKYPELERVYCAAADDAFPTAISKRMQSIEHWPELLAEAERGPYKEKLKSEPFASEDRFSIQSSKRGASVPVVDYREILFDTQGKPVGLLGRLVDDSFRSMAFDALIRQSWKEIATSMTRRYLHDFNNTIAGIYSLSELFAEPGSDPKSTAEAMGHIRDNSIRAQDLTRKIRLLNTLETGESGYFDLRKLMEEQVDYMQALLPKGAKIELVAKTKECPIHLDPNLFKQVILHLTSNAYDACGDDAEIEIRLLERESESNPSCLLEFQDNGRGFTPEETENATLPFYTTKNKDKHPGLGLSIAKDFIEKLGGNIELANTDKGGVVKLTFSLIQQGKQANENQPAEASPKSNKPKPRKAETTEPPSILIYAWEDMSRHPLLAKMEQAGWKTRFYLDPRDVILDLASEAKTDGVIVFQSALDDRAEPLVSELGRARNCDKIALLALEAGVDSVSTASRKICGFVASGSTKPTSLLKDLKAYFQ